MITLKNQKGLPSQLGLPEAGWWAKYSQLRHNAGNRGTDFKLSFRQYLLLAQRAGLRSADQIGCKSYSDFQVGRVGDTGPYSFGNCRFITMGQNQREKYENGGHARGVQKQKRQAPFRNHTTRVTDFVVRSPDGSIHVGSNLAEFCREKDLSYQLMCQVCRGARIHHRDWVGWFIYI